MSISRGSTLSRPNTTNNQRSNDLTNIHSINVHQARNHLLHRSIPSQHCPPIWMHDAQSHASSSLLTCSNSWSIWWTLLLRSSGVSGSYERRNRNRYQLSMRAIRPYDEFAGSPARPVRQRRPWWHPQRRRRLRRKKSSNEYQRYDSLTRHPHSDFHRA
jgi:hypothetical protein